MKAFTPETTATLADLLLFKLSWALLVVFQLAGVVPALGIIAWKIVGGVSLQQNLALVVLTFVAGVAMDCQLVYAGLFDFPGTVLPLWLVMLWLSFALTMPLGFAFLGRLHPAWQALIGCAAGCLGYGAGMWLGAVRFGAPWPYTLVVVGSLWALFIPAVLALAGSLPWQGSQA